MSRPVLQMNNVSVDYDMEEGTVHAVRGATYELLDNETLALVGESGCGKSQSSYAAIGLVQPPGRTQGEILFWPTNDAPPINLLSFERNSPEIRKIRGGRISMIFQEPMSSLSPVHQIGTLLDEVLKLHPGISPEEQARRTRRNWLGRLAGLVGGLACGALLALAVAGVGFLLLLARAVDADSFAVWFWWFRPGVDGLWAAIGVVMGFIGWKAGFRLATLSERRARRRRAVELLAQVGIPDPARRYQQYSFEFSGGMRQRIMIAIALACNPRVLFADEPTTGLDVTIQAQILELIRGLQTRTGMSVILITHDLAVVAERADRVAIMYLGRIVELADVYTLFATPRHPYTVALMRSVIGSPLTAEGRLATIRGTVPGPLEDVPGCPFHPRCDRFMAGVCDRVVPEFKPVDDKTQAACHLYGGGARAPS
jgi:oligopeptide/dipeptide ABC transporter ATP-binding protein